MPWSGVQIPPGLLKGTAMKKIKILYTCPTCLANYRTERAAVECASQVPDYRGLSVGSVVVVEGCGTYGENRFTGGYVAYRKPAVMSSTCHFDRSPLFVPFCAIAGLHIGEGHRALVTLAVPYAAGVRYGWNPANGEGHYPMLVPGVPMSRQKSKPRGYATDVRGIRKIVVPQVVQQWADSFKEEPVICECLI